jgi:hypothetical protein
MKISSTAQQAIDVVKQSAETQQALATAILSKQNQVSKQQGEAVLQLLGSATGIPTRGIDVRA